MTSGKNSFLARNRVAYIIEAAVEYFISLLITDAFITTLLVQSGVSDAVTGIIMQLASFAFVAQLVSVFYRRRKGMKVWVTTLHVINQVVFALLYMVPGINLPQSMKVAILVVLFLGGHIIQNIVSPYKISWLMSFVDDKSRGRFTANKEIVSLLGGMIFSLVMGNRVDYYMANREYTVAFALCAVTILVMALIHFICLIAVKDYPKDSAWTEDCEEHIKFGDSLKEFFGNKGYLKVILAVVLWHIITGMSVSFYGSYKTQTLGFNLQDVAILSGVAAIARALFSRAFGKYADKNSWAKMLYICFIIVGIAFFANIFVIKRYMKLMFIIYSIVHGIAMAGINSGVMNITFDFVPKSHRSAALGVSSSVGGLVSFFTSLAGGAILAYVQASGNRIGTFEVYGQQVLSAISFVFCVILVIYMKTVILKISTKNS